MKQNLIILIIFFSYTCYSQDLYERETYNGLLSELEVPKALRSNSAIVGKFEMYIHQYPDGFYLEEVKKKCKKILYSFAMEKKIYRYLDLYLLCYPDDRHYKKVEKIKNHVVEIDFKKAMDENSLGSIGTFLRFHSTATDYCNRAQPRYDSLLLVRDYSLAIEKNTIWTYKRFITRSFAKENKTFDDDIEKRWWRLVRKDTVVEQYEEFVEFSSNAEYKRLAQFFIEFEFAKKENTIAAYEEVINSDKSSPYIEETEILLNELLKYDKREFMFAEHINTHEAYTLYLEQNPYGKYRKQAEKTISDFEIEYAKFIENKFQNMAYNAGFRIMNETSDRGTGRNLNVKINDNVIEDNNIDMTIEVSWTANLITPLGFVLSPGSILDGGKKVTCWVKGDLKINLENNDSYFNEIDHNSAFAESADWANNRELYLGTMVVLTYASWETAKWAGENGYLANADSYNEYPTDNDDEVRNETSNNKINDGNTKINIKKVKYCCDENEIFVGKTSIYWIILGPYSKIYIKKIHNSGKWYFVNGWGEKNRGTKSYNTIEDLIETIN